MLLSSVESKVCLLLSSVESKVCLLLSWLKERKVCYGMLFSSVERTQSVLCCYLQQKAQQSVVCCSLQLKAKCVMFLPSVESSVLFCYLQQKAKCVNLLLSVESKVYYVVAIFSTKLHVYLDIVSRQQYYVCQPGTQHVKGKIPNQQQHLLKFGDSNRHKYPRLRLINKFKHEEIRWHILTCGLFFIIDQMLLGSDFSSLVHCIVYVTGYADLLYHAAIGHCIISPSVICKKFNTLASILRFLLV